LFRIEDEPKFENKNWTLDDFVPTDFNTSLQSPNASLKSNRLPPKLQELLQWCYSKAGFKKLKHFFQSDHRKIYFEECSSDCGKFTVVPWL